MSAVKVVYIATLKETPAFPQELSWLKIDLMSNATEKGVCAVYCIGRLHCAMQQYVTELWHITVRLI